MGPEFCALPVFVVFWPEFELLGGASEPEGTREENNTGGAQYVFHSQWVTHQLAQLPVPSRHLLFSFPGALLMSVSVERLPNSPLWMAVCDYRGPSISLNLAWLLPRKTESQTSMELEQEGQFLKARLTYQFSLALQEGQNLTCVYRHDHGSTEKTVHVPKYCEHYRNYSKYYIFQRGRTRSVKVPLTSP